MDGFIDRLAELWKSLFGSTDDGRNEARRTGIDEEQAARGGSRDPDFQAAWEELDEYIRTGRESSRQRQDRGGNHARGPGGYRAPRSVDESLRQDYANLEVPFGADIDEVKKSYKRLMMKYHPDKHAGNPEKQRMALEISKKINESFERIRSRQEKRG